MPLPQDAHLPNPTGRITADPARFCTGHTLAAGEPLAGTGSHQDRNILIRWPKGKWEHSLRLAKCMPDDLAKAIEDAVEAGWRVNLIDRKADKDRCVFVFPDALRFDLAPGDFPSLIRTIISDGDVSAFPSRPTARSCIFVCTHGKHDACCAKWGFAAYKALAAEALNYDSHFDIWEITHLGGCRFAGGALVLPARRKYGRRIPRDAKGLLQAEARDLPHLPAYRGYNGHSAPQQVAEITALRALPEGTVVYSVSNMKALPDQETWRVATSTGTITVLCTSAQVHSYGACEDLAKAKTLGSRTVWSGEVL